MPDDPAWMSEAELARLRALASYGPVPLRHDQLVRLVEQARRAIELTEQVRLMRAELDAMRAAQAAADADADEPRGESPR